VAEVDSRSASRCALVMLREGRIYASSGCRLCDQAHGYIPESVRLPWQSPRLPYSRRPHGTPGFRVLVSRNLYQWPQSFIMISPFWRSIKKSPPAAAAAVLTVMAVCLCSTGAHAGERATGAKEPVQLCGAPVEAHKRDFRDRTTEQYRWNIEDNKTNHLDPARSRMAQGDFTKRVLVDLDFTLVRYPNHVPALQALVQYVRGGGKPYDLPAPECYIQWARDYAPDDIDVLLVQGYFYWTRNDLERAVEAYEAAIRLNKESVEAHYYLGLVHFAKQNFPKAAEHGSIAYGLGYPLPGLMDKLKTVGFDISVARKGSSELPH
jgi:hypothetical protein